MRHGSTLFAWMALRAAAQAAIILLLARQLGAQPYGEFIVAIAVASFLTPFAGIGLSQMVLRNGPRDPKHIPIYFARAIHWWIRTAPLSAIIAIVLAIITLPPQSLTLAAFAAIGAEVLVVSLTDIHARRRQAMHRINALGATNAGLPITRLLALGLLFIVHANADTVSVFWTYSAASMAYAVSLWLLAPASSHLTKLPVPEPMASRDGLPFSLAALATRVQLEFNKPVLAHSGFGLAGTYNVAQRAIDLASMPLLALQEVLWPRLFAQKTPVYQLRHTGLALVVLALACGMVIWLLAPILPLLLGPSFQSSVTVTRALALLPALQALRLLINFHAIHQGRMHLIGWTYATGALCSITAVALLVPHWGMTGAAAAGYLTEITMTLTLLFGNLRKHHT